jgi:oligoribonuclease NrnB/cAMP/cGMP phosphodiesterase (DHH superfamily)
MDTIQITHNDLDGYGASTVVGVTIAVSRVVHIARYRDVAGVINAEITRLEATEAPERVILTDIALEGPTVEAILRFAGMNSERPGREHRLIVLDHHASSAACLTILGCEALPDRDAGHPQACYYAVPGQPCGSDEAPWNDPIVVLIDDTRSATKIAYDHRDLYPGPKPDENRYASALAMPILVECVDAIDLWKAERAIFDRASALNDAFWESVGTFIPEGHPAHDWFVSEVLLDLANLARDSKTWMIEYKAPAIRRSVIQEIMALSGFDETSSQRDQATRTRAARFVARTPGLFATIPGETRIEMAYGMDPGVFQRVSDVLLTEDRADLAVNVLRGGQMSLRSRRGEALALATRLGGGGHANASGATLSSTGVFSAEDAQARFREILEAALVPAQP